jgi:hypothetical protein
MKVLLLVLLVGLGACATAPADPPFNMTQCVALLEAAAKARAADDFSSTSIFLLVAQKGGCFR